MKIEYNEYRGYIWSMGISLCATIFLILYFFKTDPGADLLGTSIEIVGGLFLSLLVAFLVKVNEDRKHKKFIINLKDSYLSDFREAVKSLALKYVRGFKDNLDDFSELKDILNNNQIDIECLIYNFTIIQEYRDKVEYDQKKHPKTKGERLINNFSYLRIVYYNYCFDDVYYKICIEAEKLKKICFSENLKHIIPLFTNEEIDIIKRFEESRYYYSYSNAKFKEKERKFNKSEIQLIKNEFERLNKVLEVFQIELEEKERVVMDSDITKEIFKEHDKKIKKYNKAYDEAIKIVETELNI